MVLNEALTRVAGLMVAALLHGAFLYGLTVAQPARDSCAEQYTHASCCGAPQRARAAVRAALA